MDIIFYLIIFFSGWFVGNRVLLHNLRTAIQAEAKSLGIDLEENEREFPIFFTEKEQNSILVFDKKTNCFVCQGATLEEALARTNIKKAQVQHDNKLFWFIDGKVKISAE